MEADNHRYKEKEVTDKEWYTGVASQWYTGKDIQGLTGTDKEC